ncbi:hypothetical protein AMATHDRAFT_10297 [Amanita thiersii Skay4041]|uniref:Uncharacterized protein n=1 Tax=Amanita thiersii Skay4041 TaxID=703135 RepID=A0A2A9N692_9AGAR|nr:hypothetical protein AMATHDRAFT_10297 [Amanita thiersii Skay4041]
MMVGSSGGGTKEPDWSIEQALAQIQQLMNSVATLQNTIQQQNVVIQQLQNQAPAGQTASSPPTLKMATPPPYNGSMATLKPWEFPDILAKVMWVLSYMQSGMAQQFRDAFLTYMQLNEYQTEFVQAPLGTDVTPSNLQRSRFNP